MRRRLFFLALAGALLASACRQEDPATTVATPTPTASPSPTAVPLQDFTLEGEVQEIWTAVSESSDGAGSSPSPAASPATGSTPGTATSPAGAGSSPSPGAIDTAASGAVAVELTSYFSERGCAFKPGDLIVVRITPQTTVEPQELLDDAEFPENLENVRVTIAGVLLVPGPNCLPVAESITLLEGASPSPSPGSAATANRSRPRARTGRRTPTPTPSLAGSPGPAAQPGGSNTGASSTGSNPAGGNTSGDENTGNMEEDLTGGDTGGDTEEEVPPDEDSDPDPGEPGTGEPGTGEDDTT